MFVIKLFELLLFDLIRYLIQLLHFYQNVYTVWRYTDSFLYSHINPAIELIIIALLSDVKFVAFFPYYFFSPNFCFARLSQFIFIKRSNKFFIIEITDNICSRQFIWLQKLLQTNTDCSALHLQFCILIFSHDHQLLIQDLCHYFQNQIQYTYST